VVQFFGEIAPHPAPPRFGEGRKEDIGEIFDPPGQKSPQTSWFSPPFLQDTLGAPEEARGPGG